MGERKGKKAEGKEGLTGWWVGPGPAEWGFKEGEDGEKCAIFGQIARSRDITNHRLGARASGFRRVLPRNKVCRRAFEAVAETRRLPYKSES